MRLLRGAVWLMVVLTLVSVAGNVLTDPYFDPFFDRPDGATIERDGGDRPVWRIPAVVPRIFVDAVAFLRLAVAPPDSPRTLALLPEAPFVPPRI